MLRITPDTIGAWLIMLVLDLVKVRMQTAATTAGGATPAMLGTFVKVARNEGMCRESDINGADRVLQQDFWLYIAG